VFLARAVDTIGRQLFPNDWRLEDFSVADECKLDDFSGHQLPSLPSLPPDNLHENRYPAGVTWVAAAYDPQLMSWARNDIETSSDVEFLDARTVAHQLLKRYSSTYDEKTGLITFDWNERLGFPGVSNERLRVHD